MKKYAIIMMLAFALFLQGCTTKEDSKVNTKDASTEQEVVDEAKEITPAENVATNKPSPTTIPIVLPTTVNDTGKVMIQTVSGSRSYRYNSYIITSSNGESVVVDPTEMPDISIVDINPAAILCTHSHPDHVDAKFTDSYDVPKLMYEEGEIKTKDFNIYSILSSHASDTISTSNVIMVLEVDGLRIAHMGDIGQTALTDDQLKALGEIDIAFMQFDNSYSNMNIKNEKGFKLIEQLNPKIIIPTHSGGATDAMLNKKYGAITEYDNILQISKEDLPDTNLNVYRILNNYNYAVPKTYN